MKFPKLVIEEAKALKRHASEQERQNLNFEDLNPVCPDRCIYGQITGGCFNDRAIELIEKCAKRVYRGNKGIQMIKRHDLNGSPKDKNRFSYWSPIEVFIARRVDGQDQANEKLIQFLKGEIKTL